MGAVVAETTDGGSGVNRGRVLAVFFGKVVAFYLLGVMLWTSGAADRPYLAVFRDAHTQCFRLLHTLGSRWVVVLSAPETPGEQFDTELNVLNTTNQSLGTQPLKVQYRAYAPTVLLCGLILATPVPWVRRGWALVIGWVILQTWIACGVFLLVLKAYITPGDLALYPWGGTARALVNFITEVISTSTATQFAVPVLIWALVTFRARDVEILLGPAIPAKAAEPRPNRSERRR